MRNVLPKLWACWGFLILAVRFVFPVEPMKTRKRLLEKRAEVRNALSKWGATEVRLDGEPISDTDDVPDVDVLVSSDKRDRNLVIICFRDKFRKSDRIRPRDDSGWELIQKLGPLLRCPVNTCWEVALKNFHPDTYKRTMSTHKWEH